MFTREACDGALSGLYHVEGFPVTVRSRYGWPWEGLRVAGSGGCSGP
jgi:hypothetical protein